MNSAEILAELLRLSAADLERGQVKLRDLVNPSREIPQIPQSHTPRLAHTEQAGGLFKRVATISVGIKA